MKVLLATDGSAASREADWFLERLPFPEPTQLIIANVALVPALAQMRREFPQSVNEMLDQYHARAESLLVEEAARFEGINGTVETYPLAGHPADELVRFGEESHCDLIVLGARDDAHSAISVGQCLTEGCQACSLFCTCHSTSSERSVSGSAFEDRDLP